MTGGPEEIAWGVAILGQGGIVAFPTETVYGLGADALNESAVRRVFELKGRPATNPLIVHVSGSEMARSLGSAWPEEAALLADRFWPGPLTVVVAKAPHVPLIVTAGTEGVALRCPAHPLTLALIEAFGGPLVGPSANLSGDVSPTTAEHVRAAFSEDQVFVLDGGPCRAGIESTVVSLMGAEPQILRPGIVGAEAIEACLGRPVRRSPAAVMPGRSAPGPGMIGKHYSPRTRCVLATAMEAGAAREKDAVLGFEAIPALEARLWIAMPRAPEAYAARLYAALREADACGAERIVIERPPAPGASGAEAAIWEAVWDRLKRATQE